MQINQILLVLLAQSRTRRDSGFLHHHSNRARGITVVPVDRALDLRAAIEPRALWKRLRCSSPRTGQNRKKRDLHPYGPFRDLRPAIPSCGSDHL